MFTIPENVWARIIGYLDLKEDIPNLSLASKGFNEVTMSYLSRRKKLTQEQRLGHCKLLVDTTFSNADLNAWWKGSIAQLVLMLAKIGDANSLSDELYKQILEQVERICALVSEKLFIVYSSKLTEGERLKFPFITSDLAELFDYVKLASLGRFEKDSRFAQSVYSKSLIDGLRAELAQGGVWVKEALHSLITAYSAHKEAEPLKYPEFDRVNFDNHDLMCWWLTHYKILIQLHSGNNYAEFIKHLIVVQKQAKQKIVKFSNITALWYLAGLDLDVNCEYRHGGIALVGCFNVGALKDALFLISRGVNVNQAVDEGRAPLHYAASMLSVDGIGLLLDNGAETDAVDSRGATPLLLAAQAASEGERSQAQPAIDLLLESGADPNRQDDNRHCAASFLGDKTPDADPVPAVNNAPGDRDKLCAIF